MLPPPAPQRTACAPGLTRMGAAAAWPRAWGSRGLSSERECRSAQIRPTCGAAKPPARSGGLAAPSARGVPLLLPHGPPPPAPRDPWPAVLHHPMCHIEAAARGDPPLLAFPTRRDTPEVPRGCHPHQWPAPLSPADDLLVSGNAAPSHSDQVTIPRAPRARLPAWAASCGSRPPRAAEQVAVPSPSSSWRSRLRQPPSAASPWRPRPPAAALTALHELSVQGGRASFVPC